MELRGEDTFADSHNWEKLARARKLRLPMWRFPANSSGLRKWLKKLDIPVEQYLEDNNEKNLRQFGVMNPDWPLRAWVGIQLENLSTNEEIEKVEDE